MTWRAKIHLIGLPLMPILILASTGSKCADAQASSTPIIRRHFWVPIGHISWVVDLKENHFSSVATGSIAGLLRLFLDAQGSVAAEGRLSGGKPVPSKFQLKLLAGKWSDEIGIVFSGNRAKESVLSTAANQSADYVPIKEGDRVSAIDPMTALLIYVGGTGTSTGNARVAPSRRSSSMVAVNFESACSAASRAGGFFARAARRRRRAKNEARPGRFSERLAQTRDDRLWQELSRGAPDHDNGITQTKDGANQWVRVEFMGEIGSPLFDGPRPQRFRGAPLLREYHPATA